MPLETDRDCKDHRCYIYVYVSLYDLWHTTPIVAHQKYRVQRLMIYGIHRIVGLRSVCALMTANDKEMCAYYKIERLLGFISAHVHNY